MKNLMVQFSMKEEISIDGEIIEEKEQYWIHSENSSITDLKNKINEELKESIDVERGEILIYTEKWTKIFQDNSQIILKNSGRKEYYSDEGLVEIELITIINFDPDDISPESIEKYFHESFLH